MNEINLSTNCPACGKSLSISADVDFKTLAPKVRSKLAPVGSAYVYHITSDQIKVFLTQKAKMYSPEVKVEVVPRYTEKKRRSEMEQHHAYASLRVAFSEHILEKKDTLGWYGKIGENDDNLKIIPSMFTNIIKLYKYNPEYVNAWVKNYKTLDRLEESFGMTEAYINDLRKYCQPQRVPTQNGESWIIFAASPEAIIQDMLTDVDSSKVNGTIKIQDVYQISKDIVEWIVYLYPQEIKLAENPHVKELLLGEVKK